MRIIWVYLNVFVYVLFHIIPIRKRYKHPERYSIEERFKYIQRACHLIVKRSGSKVIVEGRENLLDQNVLYVSNHPSMIDPYFIGYAIDKQTGAVIAGDLWFNNIPILSPWFRSIGCIFVNRKNPREALKAINVGIENIKKGHSLLIFPEGEITKIVTQEVVADYHSGGLKLATEAQVPIIPIVIMGTEKIYTAHEVIGRLRKGTVRIKILEPYTKHLYENISVKDMAMEIQTMTKEVIESNQAYH
ncbi:MAG TPA: lysophospholipid acyltransferase family protein [Haloplasmataceae bacterium]